MRDSLIVSLFLFFVINVLLLAVFYGFLSHQGFGIDNFIIASVMFIVASALAGYIVISDLLDEKESQDERLSHITREILHEINLPLSTIDANLSMLKKTKPDTKAEKRLSRIEAASSRLRRLYEELSYSIKKEILPIDKEIFDLSVMIQERVVLLQELGRNKFVLSLESSMIEVDKIGLEQVIDNILENSMKFSSPNTEIELTLANDRLTIQDRGAGMDETQLLRIYERYYQCDGNITGEGIGMALVKRYCDTSDIGIKITSKVGEGTSVALDLSLVRL